MNEKDLQAEKHVDSAYELLCREPEDDGAIREAAWHYRRAALLRADTSWQQLYTSLAEKVERLLPGKEDETFLIVNTYHNTKCKVRPLDLTLRIANYQMPAPALPQSCLLVWRLLQARSPTRNYRPRRTEVRSVTHLL